MLFIKYNDPGHGWLKVPKPVFYRPEYTEIWNKVSGYSYEDRDNIYLEEDQDLYLFGKVAAAVAGVTLAEWIKNNIVDTFTDDRSKIRELARYHAPQEATL